ncbi:MAG: hypothetical protein JWL99_2094 [Streptomyces oryziradicis]|jgi:hypothetical protein|nr:hypothetical protein [Actinacidiphila oryziradicis]
MSAMECPEPLRVGIRTQYEGTTLRDRLGLRQPVWEA